MAWIGFDVDGTIAHDHGGAWGPPGPPIPSMVTRIKAYRAQGHEVRLFTARVSCTPDLLDEVIRDLEAWSLLHLGEVLPITATKDLSMWALFDDRVVQVERNTGRVLEDVIAQVHAAIADHASGVDEFFLVARLRAILGDPVSQRTPPRDRP